MHYTQLVHVIHHEHHCPEVICVQHKLSAECSGITLESCHWQSMKLNGSLMAYP